MITKNEFTPENWIFDLDFDLCDTSQGYLWGEGHLFLTSTTRKLVFTDCSLNISPFGLYTWRPNLWKTQARGSRNHLNARILGRRRTQGKVTSCGPGKNVTECKQESLTGQNKNLIIRWVHRTTPALPFIFYYPSTMMMPVVVHWNISGSFKFVCKIIFIITFLCFY